jgi:hypothetical protein
MCIAPASGQSRAANPVEFYVEAAFYPEARQSQPAMHGNIIKRHKYG